MKGEQADYVIPLSKAFSFPPKKRITKALAVIRAFVKKHARTTEFAISNEVNEFLHLHSKNIPKKVMATLLLEDKKVTVFLQGGKGMEIYKKMQAEKKKKGQKKDDKKDKDEKAEKESDEEKKKKLEDKKEKEDSAKAAGIKRKTA